MDLFARKPLPWPPTGHVDFSYEVSRSLAACQGALLVVDAAQVGQQATKGGGNGWLCISILVSAVPCWWWTQRKWGGGRRGLKTCVCVIR